MNERKMRREADLPEIYLYEKNTKSVTYRDFVNKELILFSNADNERSIPSMVDGTCFFSNFFAWDIQETKSVLLFILAIRSYPDISYSKLIIFKQVCFWFFPLIARRTYYERILFKNPANLDNVGFFCFLGLKPGQRKVLFTCMKRNDKHEVKVAQLAGSIAELSAYHHGEVRATAFVIPRV